LSKLGYHTFNYVFFYQGPLLEWSLISYVYIKTLFNGMVIDFHVLSYRGPLQGNGHRSFISKPSPMEWSLISYVYIKTFFIGMIIDFICLYQGSLQWNGHWFHQDPLRWNVIDFHVFKYQDPLWWNGHWFCMFISRPSPMEWSLISYVYIQTPSDEMVIDFLNICIWCGFFLELGWN